MAEYPNFLFFRALHSLFDPESDGTRLSWRHRFVRMAMLVGSGMLMATAFPPLNWSAMAFAALAPLVLLSMRRHWVWGFAAGWLWGIGWSFCAFFWLREIHMVLPWLMAPVLAVYYGFWGLGVAVFSKYILLPAAVRREGWQRIEAYREYPWYRQGAFVILLAASFVGIEYLRHGVLPWNYLAASQYRNLPLIQSAAWWGTYGVSFILVAVNVALALAFRTVRVSDGAGVWRYRRPVIFMAALLLLAGNAWFGVRSMRRARVAYENAPFSLRVALVQGGLSQRRFGTEADARAALRTYLELSATQLAARPDWLLWPETAISYPLRSATAIGREYRAGVTELARRLESPVLVGSLEYDVSVTPPGTLNSALLLDGRDILRGGYLGQYDKVHPVPFGEFVPWRRYLPGWVVRLIDMQRDLTPGKSLAPLAVNNRVRAGVSICFEDIFPYISRGEFLRGANILAVITNDAWYPASSEPEQHLANAIFRAIETGLPMVRCGNDSASVLVRPDGAIIWSMAGEKGWGAAHLRGAGAAVVEVKLYPSGGNGVTFYMRYGDWWVGVCVCLVFLGMGWVFQAWRDDWVRRGLR